MECQGNNVVVYSYACHGDYSCKGLQSQTAYAFGRQRALTAEEEEEAEEDPSPPTKMVIPENTCVGDGSCKDCQYLLEKFPGRCNNELSPSDVSPEHGNVCKLCRVSNVFRGMAFPPTHIISSPFAFSFTPFLLHSLLEVMNLRLICQLAGIANGSKGILPELLRTRSSRMPSRSTVKNWAHSNTS